MIVLYIFIVCIIFDLVLMFLLNRASNIREKEKTIMRNEFIRKENINVHSNERV